MDELWCVYSVGAGEENAFRVDAPRPTVRDLMASFQKSRPVGNRYEKFHWRLKFPDDAFGYSWLDVHENVACNKELVSPGVYAIFAKLVDVSPRAVSIRANKPRKPARRDDDDEDENTIREESEESSEESSVDELDHHHHEPLEEFEEEEEPPAAAAAEEHFPVREDEEVVLQSPEEVQAAVLKRQQTLAATIEDNQREAREEIRRREDLKASESVEFDRLRLELGPKLKAWSEEFGKKKNIRALLADMDKVMWPEAQWQPISIADLIMPNKVKKAYYKASRYVHPDKLVGLTCEQRYIGQTVFDALSQAYAQFEEETASS